MYNHFPIPHMEPRFVDPRFAEPRFVEPRLAEPRFVEPSFVEPRLPRMTKSFVEEQISLAVRVPLANLRFERLPEYPSVWRHACIPAGVVILPHKVLTFPMGKIDFAFCSSCGKVHYVFEEFRAP